MTRATVLQEVRQMRFEERYARPQRRELTVEDAAEMLGVTERTFRRWRGRFLRWAPRRVARVTCPAACRVFLVQL